MPRIKLAHWHGSHQPGDEIDVTDSELAALRRDGRVAEVLGDSSASPEPAPDPQPSAEVSEAPAPEGRGRKAR